MAFLYGYMFGMLGSLDNLLLVGVIAPFLISFRYFLRYSFKKCLCRYSCATPFPLFESLYAFGILQEVLYFLFVITCIK